MSLTFPLIEQAITLKIPLKVAYAGDSDQDPINHRYGDPAPITLPVLSNRLHAQSSMTRRVRTSGGLGHREVG